MAVGGSAPIGEVTALAEGVSSGAARTPVERSPAGDVAGAPPHALVGQLRGGEVEPLDFTA